MAQGIKTFPSIAAAVREGYQIYDRRDDGTFIARIKTTNGWAMAIVEVLQAA